LEIQEIEAAIEKEKSLDGRYFILLSAS
jgi:hypothetical protein